MSKISIGPALAGFPAFPVLPLAAFADPASLPPEVLAQIQATFAALNFQFTPNSFSFELDSTVFGVPGAFDYRFEFTGDFSAMVGPPELLFAAFNPALAAAFQIRFQTARTTDVLTGTLAIAAEVDEPGPALPFLSFFSTLLDPRNFTQDLLAAFTGDATQFTTLDLSSFAGGVISSRPNGATISRDGTISRPDGGFVDSAWGVVSFNDEIVGLQFAEVLGGNGGDVLGADTNATRIRAGGGDDVLLGSTGGDTLEGEGDADLLSGGGGDDMLSGGLGSDTLFAGAGNDSLDGGEGNDRLFAGSGLDTLTGGTGADLFVIQRGAGNVTVVRDFSLADGDTIDFSTLSVLFGKETDGTLNARIGSGTVNQYVIFDGLTDASQVRPGMVGTFVDPALTVAKVRGGTLSDDAGNGDGTMVGSDLRDILKGLGGDDLLLSGDGDDWLRGDGGNDRLFGQAGDDRVEGGAGDDVVDGGLGDDILSGGSGFDMLTGGFGTDVFAFARGETGYDRIVDFEFGVDKIDISKLFTSVRPTVANFSDFVRVTPLGPTELTGFISVDRDGPGSRFDFEIIAQIDGDAFAIVNDLSQSTLTVNDFIIG